MYTCAGELSSSSMYHYRNIDKSMRNGDEILALWRDLGIDTKNHLSFMCGSGWRVSEILWYARVMGLNDTSMEDALSTATSPAFWFSMMLASSPTWSFNLLAIYHFTFSRWIGSTSEKSSTNGYGKTKSNVKSKKSREK